MKPRKAQTTETVKERQGAAAELPMSQEDWEEFSRGVMLFNTAKFWHAHEAWEQVWNRHRGEGRFFVQGLIQLAAAYHHLITKRSFTGMLKNFDKARGHLEPFCPEYMGTAVEPILRSIDALKNEAARVGETGFSEISLDLLPKLQFHRSGNPDLLVEMKDICGHPRFREGVEQFNGAYYWEAHEAWEEVWREQEGEAKPFIQAFVQAATAFNFLKIGKVSSASYLFEKAIDCLREFEHLRCPFDVAQFINQLGETLLQIKAIPTNGTPSAFSFRQPKIECHS
ncbi:MAG TPA: DUF309 domain-containing protein [Bacteroidota bacterium]|nr:DUF309 domain-containing protein [Bacteroidota bacterium]